MSHPHPTHHSPTHAVLEFVKRIWSLGIIALVGYLSFLAIQYLVVTMMFPTEAPDQIVGVPLRLTEDVLSTRRDDWAGLAAVEQARSPIAHYHHIDGWIQPDAVNNCTQSGCHAPLPHSRHKEVRAFLNMHSTSMHCGVCHMKTANQPLATTWYDINTGATHDPPVVLQIYAWLTSAEGKAAFATPTRELQTRLVDDLRLAAEQADQEPGLIELANHFAAVRYDSPAFKQLLEKLEQTLPRKFRGEYNTKIALRGAKGEPILAHPDSAVAVQKYLTQADDLSAEQRKATLANVHSAKRATPLQCRQCHTAEGGMLDFAAAGYPPERIKSLTQPMIFNMIANISDGQPFYMPSFIGESGESRPTPEQ